MTTIETPAAIQTFIEATNRGDAEAFAAAFTHDADLNDWGRAYHGRDGVRGVLTELNKAFMQFRSSAASFPAWGKHVVLRGT